MPEILFSSSGASWCPTLHIIRGDNMSKPLIVISKFRVKQGKLEDLKKYYQKILDIIEANQTQKITSKR
jgi:hypothetical protein